MIKELPQFDLAAIKYGRERCGFANFVISLAESFREDWFPGLNVWDSLQMAAIMFKMYQIHLAGRAASPSDVSRSTGMPRTTVIRKLSTLKKLGLVDQYGTRFVLSVDGLNRPHLLEGFHQRLVITRSSLAKIMATLPTEETRAIHNVMDTRVRRSPR